MFKKLLRAFGVGGPSVDAVLSSAEAVPGGEVSGEVRITGGDHEVDIERVVLLLEARAEVEHGGDEHHAAIELNRAVAGERFRVGAGQQQVVPFTLPVPWEAPLTAVDGHPLPGIGVGVRTEVAVAGSVDKSDLDGVHVVPMPAQSRVLDAFGALGMLFRSTEMHAGRLVGVPQTAPLFQELEFTPPERFAGRLAEVELSFVATPDELHVVLEADKRGGLLRSEQEVFGRFAMPHAEAERADWCALVEQWLGEAEQRRGLFGGHEHGHVEHGRRGPGWGGVAAGAALGLGAGVVGGMVAGEVVDEIGDFAEGED